MEEGKMDAAYLWRKEGNNEVKIRTPYIFNKH